MKTTRKDQRSEVRSQRSGAGLTADRWSLISRRSAFTLIELLTVIGIIAILAALLFPAVKKVLQRAEINQARGDVKNIEQAIKAFVTEYGYLPGACGSSDTTFDNFGVMDALRGLNATLNPRKIEFFVIPPRKGALNGSNLVDPWNRAYVIILDCNYDNNVATPYASPNNSIPGQSVVISYGPNGVQDTPGKDDIVNFQ